MDSQQQDCVRIYAIFLSKDKKKYKIQGATGFVIKLADTKFIVSCLNVAICDLESHEQKKFI